MFLLLRREGRDGFQKIKKVIWWGRGEVCRETEIATALCVALMSSSSIAESFFITKSFNHNNTHTQEIGVRERERLRF